MRNSRIISTKNNWGWGKLLDFCDIQTGKRDVDEGNPKGNYVFFTCAISPTKSDTYSFDGKCLILPGNGANVGECFYFNGKFEAYQRTYVLNNFKIDPQFLYYYFQSNWKNHLHGQQLGSATNYILMSNFSNFRVPGPPPEEQRRIADLLACADRLRRLRRYARELSDTYLQSVFVEMFGEPDKNPKGWDLVKLGNMMIFMTSGSRGWAEYYSDKGALFLRVQNVGANQLLLDEVAYVQPPDNVEGRRTRVQSGDLIISATADIGRTGVIPENFPVAYINQHLFLIRLQNINPVFVAGYFSTPSGKAQILRLNREGVKSGLNFDDAKGLTVFNPPLAEQEWFADVVRRYERLRAQQHESERQAEMLFQSLLAQAFGGA